MRARATRSFTFAMTAMLFLSCVRLFFGHSGRIHVTVYEQRMNICETGWHWINMNVIKNTICVCTLQHARGRTDSMLYRKRIYLVFHTATNPIVAPNWMWLIKNRMVRMSPIYPNSNCIYDWVYRIDRWCHFLQVKPEDVIDLTALGLSSGGNKSDQRHIDMTCNWTWLWKLDETGWNWMKLDETGWNWMKLDETGRWWFTIHS